MISEFFTWLSSDGIIALINIIGRISANGYLAIISLFCLIYCVRTFKKQQGLMLYVEYKKRRQEIFLNLPDQIHAPTFKIEDLHYETKLKTLNYIRAYFDLCNEEYQLYLNNQLNKRYKKNWTADVQYYMAKPAFQDVWLTLNPEFRYNAKFSALVKKILSKQNKPDKDEKIGKADYVDYTEVN